MKSGGTESSTGDEEVRINDIAAEAKASSSAVYSFLNDRYYGRQNRRTGTGISLRTQERILQACRKLRFQPRNQRVFTRIYPEAGGFAFLLNSGIQTPFSNGYFSRFFEGAVAELEEDGHALMFGSFDLTVDYLAPGNELHPILAHQQINKFIVAGKVNETLLEHLRGLYGFVVALSRPVEAPGAASIIPDYAMAGRLAVEEFVKRGHRSIAVAGDTHFHPDGYNTRRLLAGVVAACEEAGLPWSADRLILRSTHREPSAGHFVECLRAVTPSVTGVFCLDDASAFSTAQVLREVGIEVPGEVSIIGCNGEPNFIKRWPELTTIYFPNEEMGRKAVRSLRQMAIDGAPEDSPVHVVPVTLQPRGSVADK